MRYRENADVVEIVSYLKQSIDIGNESVSLEWNLISNTLFC